MLMHVVKHTKALRMHILYIRSSKTDLYKKVYFREPARSGDKGLLINMMYE